MSGLGGVKPVIGSKQKQQEKNDSLLKELALGVLLSNGNNMMSFRASDLAECANAHNGIAVQIVQSEIIGEEKIIVFTIIPKEEVEAPKSNLISLS